MKFEELYIRRYSGQITQEQAAEIGGDGTHFPPLGRPL